MINFLDTKGTEYFYPVADIRCIEIHPLTNGDDTHQVVIYGTDSSYHQCQILPSQAVTLREQIKAVMDA